MADTNGANGNGHANGKRLEAAAESILLKLVARWMMAVVVPLLGLALLTVGGWFATKVIAATEENTKATNELRKDFETLIKHQLPAITGGLNSRIDAEAGALRGRIDAHVDRFRELGERWRVQNDRDNVQETRIEQLRERVWQMPAPAPVRPTQAPQSAPTPSSIEPYPR